MGTSNLKFDKKLRSRDIFAKYIIKLLINSTVQF